MSGLARLWQGVAGWLADAGRLVVPLRCAVCHCRLSAGEQHVCAACFHRLPFTRFRGERGNVVERMFWGTLPIVRANAFLYYHPRSGSHQIFWKLKYHDRPQVGRSFGRMMAADLAATDFFSGIDLVVPLPLSDVRLRQRGYNQSRELARGVCEYVGLPLEAEAVERVVDNPSQTHKRAFERRDNVRDIFRLRHPERLARRHVLLIDDIITTGATLQSCMREMAKAEGVRISVLALGLAGTHTRATLDPRAG